MEDQPGPYPSEREELWKVERQDAVRQDTKQKKTSQSAQNGNIFTKKKAIPRRGVIYTTLLSKVRSYNASKL